MISMRQCPSALVCLHRPANLDSFCTNPEILGEKRVKSGRVSGWGVGGWAIRLLAVLLSVFFRQIQALYQWLLVLCAEVGHTCPVLPRTVPWDFGTPFVSCICQDRRGYPGISSHHPTQIPTVHPIPMTHRVIGMGWTVEIWVGWLGTSPLIPSHPDVSLGCDGQLSSGWDGITWDVPNHPTQIPTVHHIPTTHRDGTGLPGMSPTIQPRSQLSITSQRPIGMGRDYLGCPQPSHPDPNCPSHPNDTSGWDGITWVVPNHPTQIPTVHHIPMTHRDGMGLPGMSPTIQPRSQLSITSQWHIGMGRDYLGCPQPSHPYPNCPSHPNDPSGWDGITWDVPNHPTQILTVHHIPMTHRDETGLPGMSHTILPRSQLSIPSRWPIRMGRDYLGCPQPSHPDPNCPSHPNDPSGWDGITWDVPMGWTVGIKAPGGGMVGDIPGSPIQSRWDIGMGWTVGIKAPGGGMVGDIPGSPIQSRWDVGMGWTVGIKAPGGGMVGDIPGSPIQSWWDIGMGWTVGIKAPGGGMVGDIPGSPIQSRWDVGMGWTVGIKAPGGGMVGDIPGSPIQFRWDVGMGWCGIVPCYPPCMRVCGIPWDCPWQYWTSLKWVGLGIT